MIAAAKCESEKIPCDFSEENRDRLEKGKIQFEDIDKKLDSVRKNIEGHKKLTYKEAKETRRIVGCLEGKVKTLLGQNQSLLIELIRKSHGERYANALENNKNPDLSPEKLEQLRKEEELLKQIEKNLTRKFRIKLLKLGTIVVSIILIVAGSYLYSIF